MVPIGTVPIPRSRTVCTALRTKASTVERVRLCFLAVGRYQQASTLVEYSAFGSNQAARGPVRLFSIVWVGEQEAQGGQRELENGRCVATASSNRALQPCRSGTPRCTSPARTSLHGMFRDFPRTDAEARKKWKLEPHVHSGSVSQSVGELEGD